MPEGALLSCPCCRGQLPEELYGSATPVPCPTCSRDVIAEVFPAWRKPLAPAAPIERVAMQEEASCFFHAQNRSVAACGRCGRFLCALCDIELEWEHLCPQCLSSGRKKGQLQKFEDSRLLWGKLALNVALLPLLVWPITIVTAPLAIVLAIHGWKKPGSLTGSTKSRHVLAVLCALPQVAGWAYLFYSLTYGT